MRRGETNLVTLSVLMFGQLLMTGAILGGMYFMVGSGGSPAPSPSPVVPNDDEQLRTISALAATDTEAAKRMGAAYLDFASILERTETQVATKEAFRSSNLRFQQALWANDPARPQLPGISAAMNAYLLQKIGPDSGAFDAATRATAVAAIRDICKALGA